MYSVEKYINYRKIGDFIKLANANLFELIEMTKYKKGDYINLDDDMEPFTEEEIKSGKIVEYLCDLLNHYEIDYMVEHIYYLKDDYSKKSLLRYKANVDMKLKEINLAFANDNIYEYFLNMKFLELLKLNQIFNYFDSDSELTNYGKEIKTALFSVIRSKIEDSKYKK